MLFKRQGGRALPRRVNAVIQAGCKGQPGQPVPASVLIQSLQATCCFGVKDWKRVATVPKFQADFGICQETPGSRVPRGVTFQETIVCRT